MTYGEVAGWLACARDQSVVGQKHRCNFCASGEGMSFLFYAEKENNLRSRQCGHGQRLGLGNDAALRGAARSARRALRTSDRLCAADARPDGDFLAPSRRARSAGAHRGRRRRRPSARHDRCANLAAGSRSSGRVACIEGARLVAFDRANARRSRGRNARHRSRGSEKRRSACRQYHRIARRQGSRCVEKVAASPDERRSRPEVAMTERKTLLPGATIGIMGGGQLGRMCASAARRMGYRVHTFSPEKNGPAAQFSDRATVANYGDEAAVTEFAREIDVLTFEFENIPATTIEWATRERVVRPRGEDPPIAKDR